MSQLKKSISTTPLKESLEALKVSLMALNDTCTISKDDPALTSLKDDIRNAIRKTEEGLVKASGP